MDTILSFEQGTMLYEGIVWRVDIEDDDQPKIMKK